MVGSKYTHIADGSNMAKSTKNESATSTSFSATPHLKISVYKDPAFLFCLKNYGGKKPEY